VRKTRKFLEWIRAKSARKIVGQMKGETLMFVPETSDGFRATIGALWSLGEGHSVSFHTFLFRRTRKPTVQKTVKRMPEAEIKEELDAFHINMGAVMQHQSKRRDQDLKKNHSLKHHFMVLAARGPNVTKELSLTDLCGLRMKVKTYKTPKGPFQCRL
jgi:hypothetical protein